MKNKRNIYRDKNGISSVLETLISVGISVTLLTIFFYSANTLYTIQDKPEVDLETKSIGIMETLISSPGDQSWEWEDNDDTPIALGLGTSPTLEYGIITKNSGVTTIEEQYSFSDSNIGIVDTCFLAGTKIVMADESYKNIEDIVVGDIVKSFDEENNIIVDRVVTNVFHHNPEEMTDYYLVINDQLRVTPNHMVYSDDGWIAADDLEIDDNLFYPRSDYKVSSIVKIFGKTYTYNFEVEGHHNYFVAMDTTEVLVHNDEFDPSADPIYGDDDQTYGGIVGLPITFDCSESQDTDCTAMCACDEYGCKCTEGYSCPIDCYGYIYYRWNFDNNSIWDTYQQDYSEQGSDPDSGWVEFWYPSGSDGCYSPYFPLPLPSGTNAYEYTYQNEYEGDAVLQVADYDVVNGVPVPGQDETITTAYVGVSVTYPDNCDSPTAKFIWFDTDGLSDDTEVYFDASGSEYCDLLGNSLEYKWEPTSIFGVDEDRVSFSIDEWTYGKCEVTLTVTETVFGRVDTFECTVNVNNLVLPETDWKPWVLTGKNVEPESNDNTFLSHPEDYYINYTQINNTYSLYEIKEKTSSDYPILDYNKIKSLCSVEVGYNLLKKALGLESEQTIYNFNIMIKIEGDSTDYSFGATYENVLMKESATRKVLIYYPPTWGEKGVEYGFKINNPPEYKQGEITIHVFIGGGKSSPIVDIPDLSINNYDLPYFINLDDYVQDPDTPDENITWEVSEGSPGGISVGIDDRTARIDTKGGWTGSEQFTFKATDEDGFSGEDDATFTINTPPNPPSNPDPRNLAIDVDVNTDLSWDGGDPDGDEVYYDVHFGTEAQPPFVERIGPYDDIQIIWSPPETLESETLYRWQISADDGVGVSDGPLWRFTTGEEPQNNPPHEPDDPDPEDKATDVSANAVLSWTGGDPDGDPVRYDVYFEANNPDPKMVSEKQPDTTYDPFDEYPMDRGIKYYWKIVAWDDQGASTEGPVWHFTTATSSITVRDPNGGEELTIGETYTIEWEISEEIEVDIELWIGEDEPSDMCKEIVLGIPGDECAYEWEVGEVEVGSDYWIKIMNSGDHEDFDFSDDTFTIKEKEKK